MKACIEKFLKVPRPRFVGVRHLISFEEEDYLTREDVHQGKLGPSTSYKL